MTILLGLLGLSVVVIVHEFGHYIAARLVGVEVEAFSIGWGPRLAGFRKWGTEWRISMFPIGGFCRMKGEEEFKTAIEKKLSVIPAEKGSYYGVSPFRRILILLSGPLANLVLAVILFSFVSLVGIHYQTAPNRIVLASELAGQQASQTPNPADLAGLKTGDKIISIDGSPVLDYSDIQEQIGLNPNRTMRVTVERDARMLTLELTPRLDKNSGQGLIGIFAWIEPLVEKVTPESPAALAGMKPGDRILRTADTEVHNTIDLLAALSAHPERVPFTVARDGREQTLHLVLSYTEDGQSDLGIEFSSLTRLEKADNFFSAVGEGAKETFSTFTTTLKGIGLLFNGVNVLKAISGPARITYIVGNAASESIKSNGLSGLPPILSFLAFLSVGLFIMNLLPIPALDGGQIVLSLAEILKRSPLSTKTIYRYQFVGTAMIMALFVLATFSDLLFFAGK